jgi:flagellar basal-body M-ring protein/flagellar hook-basal body protein fliF
MAEQENNSTNRFNQLSFQQKMAVAVAVAALFALIAGMWMWGQTPDYRVLYSNLSDRDGGAIIESLQQMNIPYKFADGGGALMVPSNQVHEARLKLASQGLPKGGNVGFELMDNQKFGITQFAEQVNYQRALEGELARTVESIDSVAAAQGATETQRVCGDSSARGAAARFRPGQRDCPHDFQQCPRPVRQERDGGGSERHAVECQP